MTPKKCIVIAKYLTKSQKKAKNQDKKLHFFCLCAFTQKEEMSLIKKVYFMLNLLNLKSFSRHHFFVVASSLSELCGLIVFEKKATAPLCTWALCKHLRSDGDRVRLGRYARWP